MSSMSRIDDLTGHLGLRPHPEGGRYVEAFRSILPVAAHGGSRSASTGIFFLLAAGEVSRWHRVRSDELWHWYEGAPLELLLCERPGTTPIIRQALGPVEGDILPQRAVPAGWWQAARSIGAFTLVGCTVAPGFDFTDFTLIDRAGDDAAWLRRQADPRFVDG